MYSVYTKGKIIGWSVRRSTADISSGYVTEGWTHMKGVSNIQYPLNEYGENQKE